MDAAVTLIPVIASFLSAQDVTGIKPAAALRTSSNAVKHTTMSQASGAYANKKNWTASFLLHAANKYV